eukprot:51872_1
MQILIQLNKTYILDVDKNDSIENIKYKIEDQVGISIKEQTLIFNGKQLNEFTELTIKAVPNINKETIKSIFRSIKNGTNVSCNQYELPINGLEIWNQYELTNTLREVHSAKQHLIKLTMSTE